MRSVTACTVVLLGCQALLHGQGGPQILTFRSAVDDSDQPYTIYLPRTFRADSKYPLVVSLHSEQSNHRLNLRQVLGVPSRLGELDSEDLRYFPVVRDEGYIVVCPLARGTMGYQGIPEQDVYDVLADVERRFPIDRDRVYLTGISMGGSGALRLALTRPDVWAAVAPICPAALPGIEDLAPNALNLPIRIYHGEQDPIVPVVVSRAWQRRLLDLGNPVDYIEFPGVRHNAWDFSYTGAAVLQWFSKFRRSAFPERVRLVADSYRYASAYWVRIDGLTPGTLASIEAKRISAGTFDVQTRGVDGFTLTLEHMAAVVVIDGTPLRVKPSMTLSFERSSGRWKQGTSAAAPKRRGAEGPIEEAVSDRQIYVYGTLGAADADELAARRRMTETAAAWSSTQSRLGLKFRVMADTAVTDTDLDTASVVAFGTRQSNSLIARLAPRLPLELSPGAADFGLLFVAPTAKHYVLVSSGLPWWTAADEAARGGDFFAPFPYRTLTTFGDFILFKGGLNNVVAEGRFDRGWKVPADIGARMSATGAVIIH